MDSAGWAGYGLGMTGQGVWWRRMLVAGTAGLVLAGGLIAPTVAASPGDRIGTGKRTCVPGPGVNCRDVVQKWTFEHHGDLSGAKFARAKLHGADLRGARLNKANFRGVVLRHADLREASLKGANFSPTKPRGRLVRSDFVARSGCIYVPGDEALDQFSGCQRADLSYADLTGVNMSDADLVFASLYSATLIDANLTSANLSYATLNYANFTGATLTGAYAPFVTLNYANLTNANLTGVNLSAADLTGATLTGAITTGAVLSDAVYCNTTMPDGSINNSGC